MLNEIFKDFLIGLIDSLRIQSLYRLFHIVKFKKAIKKIIMTNMILLLHLIIPNTGIFYVLKLIVQQFILLLHSLYYMDLVNSLSRKKNSTVSFIDSIIGNICLHIILMILYLSTCIIKYIFQDRLWFLVSVFNIIIMSIYHSCYCYNTYWYSLQISLSNRIAIHELRWPYFVGYGILPSLIYMYTYNIWPIYNIYIACLLSVPFNNRFTYPKKENKSYARINLSIFVNMVTIIIKLIKSIPINVDSKV